MSLPYFPLHPVAFWFLSIGSFSFPQAFLSKDTVAFGAISQQERDYASLGKSHGMETVLRNPRFWEAM